VNSASAGGNKGEWVTAALGSAKTLGLDAIIWFQVNKEIDWQFQTDVPESIRTQIDGDNGSSVPSRFMEN
jgi:hypothetical protein